MISIFCDFDPFLTEKWAIFLLTNDMIIFFSLFGFNLSRNFSPKNIAQIFFSSFEDRPRLAKIVTKLLLWPQVLHGRQVVQAPQPDGLLLRRRLRSIHQ
jgi:hypothetical protein